MEEEGYGPPIEIRVSKGKTLGPNGEVWIRESYEVKIDIHPGVGIPVEEEIERAREWAIAKIDGWLPKTESIPKQKTSPSISAPTTSLLETLKSCIPPDTATMLNFEIAGNHILVKPKEFLGGDKFHTLAEIIRKFDGEYVQEGDKKKSHFKVPLTKQAPAPGPTETLGPTETPLPDIDPDELEKLPWQKFKEKAPAGIGVPGWIFSDTKKAEALLDLAKEHGPDVPVSMGNGIVFMVKLSQDRKFLQRRIEREK